MKGIMLKDLYNLKQNMKLLLFAIGVYVVMGTFTNGGMSIMAWVSMMAVLMVFSMFSYDDITKWENYGLSLPVTRVQIVAARYAAGLLLLAAAGLLSVLQALVMSFVAENQTFAENLVFLGGTTLAALLLFSILLPLCYRFGAEKSRIGIMVIFMAFFGAFLFIDGKDLHLERNEGLLLLVKLFPLLVLVLLVGSFWLSCRIYKKKEF